MRLEILTLVCAHPKNTQICVTVACSQRSYPGQEDPEFLEKATAVLNSVELTDALGK